MNDMTGLREIAAQQERDVERAYTLGLLHGINAASMARVEAEVLAFEDYGWQLDEE